MMLKRFLARANHSTFWRQPVRVWGSVFTAPTFDRLISLHAHRLGWMGSTERAFLRSIVCHDSIVADVGANQGLYSVWLARLAAGGHIYAFEPDPELFRCLEGNVRNNGLTNISAIQAAASNRSGTLAFIVNELNRGDNRVSTGPDAASSQKQVTAVTVDEAVGHSRMDILKIDAQGFEFDVLLGAQGTLQNNQDLIILFEFWPYGLRHIGCQPAKLLDLLRDAGFRIFGLGQHGRLGAMPKETLTWRRAGQYCNLVASRQIEPSVILNSAS
jgi:FkbM family methyltransferase